MEKKTRKTLLIVSAIICAIVLILVVWINFENKREDGIMEYIPVWSFQKNITTRSIILVAPSATECEEYGLVWENFEIIGNATVPNGPMKPGDAITNCSGIIIIKYVKGQFDDLVGTYVFD